MRRLSVFIQVSLDGYYSDSKSDMSWARKHDAEWNEFVSGNASGDGELLFGRVTYQMMASFWPTPQAMQMLPAVAEGMNRMKKVVFSRTLDKAEWNNTRLLKGDLVEEVRKLKSEPGPGMVILGSGSIISQLADAGLIDDFQVAVNPIVLGSGKSMFATVKNRTNLRLTKTRAFTNGNVLLCYEPA